MRLVTALAPALLIAAFVLSGCASGEEPAIVRMVQWSEGPGGGDQQHQVFETWLVKDGDSVGEMGVLNYGPPPALQHASFADEDGGRSFSNGECADAGPLEASAEARWSSTHQVSTSELAGDGYQRSPDEVAVPEPDWRPEPDGRAVESIVPTADGATTWVRTTAGGDSPRSQATTQTYVIDPRGYPVVIGFGSHDGNNLSSRVLLIESFSREEGEAAMAERFRWDEWCP